MAKQHPDYSCKNCGTQQEWKGYSYTNVYCNNVCQQEYQYNERIRIWKETGKLSKGPVKRYLAEQKEGCWKCGITSWNDEPIVLDLEHNDGNSDNNVEINLSLLCPNCHSQTPTYKGKNKGNGRHARRARYQEGKSY